MSADAKSHFKQGVLKDLESVDESGYPQEEILIEAIREYEAAISLGPPP